MINHFVQVRESTAYSYVAIPERESHQESRLAKERKRPIVWNLNSNSKLWLLEISKSCQKNGGQTNTWNMLSPNFPSSAFSSWSHLPWPFPQISNAEWFCLFWMTVHSVQLRTSPCSPGGSPENCLEVSFLEVAWLPSSKQGGCLWSKEHFLSWPIHEWWAAHLVRGSHGSKRLLCVPVCLLYDAG